MTGEEERPNLSFFEFIDSLAEEKGISRGSIEYTELAESRMALYAYVHDIGPEERRYLSILDIQRIIRHACDTYESALEEERKTMAEEDFDVEGFNRKDIAEFNARHLIGNHLLLAYTLAYEFVDDVSQEVARNHGLHTNEKTVSEMSQKEVIEQLHDADLIGDTLKSQIEHVADRRHELAHEIEQRYTLNKFGDDIVGETVKPLYAVDGLYELRYGTHAYVPADEMTG